MNPLIRRLGKVLGYGLLTLAALFGVLLVALHVCQDKIIALMVAELNQRLAAKVEVARIELSAWDKFPQLALRFQKLKVHGSLPGRTAPLAVADRLSLTFDLWDLLGSNYVIDRVYLENADVQVYVDARGETNYNVFRKDTAGSTAGAGPVAFDLRGISLRNVQVRYTDLSIDQQYDVLADKVAARLVVQGPDVRILAQGDLRSRHIRVNDENYFADKPLRVDSELGYNLDTRRLAIRPSLVTVRGSAFEVVGQVRQRPRTFVDLKVSGKDTDVQTVLSLLPEKYANQYAAYRSRGDVYFSGTVTGNVGRGGIPEVNVRFGCRNASFFEQNLGKRITAANLTGTYTNGKDRNRRTSSLSLRGVTGRLQGKPFAGNFSLRDFENPYLAFDVRGELDVTSLVAFVPQDVIRRASGTLRADVKFEGNLSDLRGTKVGRFVRTSGKLGLRNVAFSLTGRPLAFHGLNGDFSFSKSDLVVSDFHGRAGSSDFRLDGWFKNVLPYLLLDGQHLRVEAGFASRFLNFDELLAAYPAAGSGKGGAGKGGDSYRFVVSPRLALDLTCHVDRVKFRRFRAQGVQGDLVLAGGQARSRDIRLRSAGGTMTLSAEVDARQPDAVRVACDAAFHHIAIDSVFYMFENFDQTFIQDRHLRGNVEARVRTDMVFNSRLDMNLPRLTADVQAKVTDGELNGFEPMQKLSKFINRNELANLRFAELENTIRIERETVFLPKMEISSNVANISAEGTHTFSQVMDYHLRIPVKALLGKNRVRGAAYATSSAPPGGKSNLFVFVRGPSDNYKIGYDTRAVADKIVDDLKHGKRDTRNGFGNPAPATTRPDPSARTQPAAEEEYFDFQ